MKRASPASLVLILLLVVNCGKDRHASPEVPPIRVPQGWSSGGGDLLKDAQNPWFLENTKTVSYCVQSDQKTFGNIPNPVGKLIAAAFLYWKKEFSKINEKSEHYLFGPVRIATQDFVESPCNQDTDIVFQFGVLTEEQKTYLGDPTEHVAISVRTNYDRKRLRARGFVYVSPDSGPLKYQSDSADEAWHRGDDRNSLFNVLLHEAGHIFGLPHVTGSGLMEATYPEKVVENSTLLKFHLSDLDDAPRFFEFGDHYTLGRCETDEGPLHKFFGLALPSECVLIEADSDGSKLQVESSHLSDLSKKIGVGEIVFNEKPVSDITPLIQIVLPAEQEVFPRDIVKLLDGTLNGPGFIKTSWVGTYRDSGGSLRRQVVVFFNPGRERKVRIGGLLDGQITLDLFESNWEAK